MNGILIEKEHISDYKIINAMEDRTETLQLKLNNAQRLGNEFKSKVSIEFMTQEGPKRVETTVWSLTKEYIQLKNGILLPLNSLIDVEF